MWCILHVLRQRSCGQRAPALKQALDDKESEIKAFVIKHEKHVGQLYFLTKHMDKTRDEMRSITNQPALILKFLQPGRLALVKDLGVGVVVSFENRGASQSAAHSHEGSAANVVVDMLLRCKPRLDAHEPPQRAGSDDKDAELQVVRVSPCTLLRVGCTGSSPVCLPVVWGDICQIPVVLSQLDGVSSIRFPLPNDVREPAVWDRVNMVLRRFSGSPPLLDPIEDMGVSDQRFTELVGKAASLQSRLVANPLHKSPDRDHLLQQYSGKVCITVCDGDMLDVALTPGPLMQMELMAEAKHLRDELHATKALKLECMKRVLRRLGHTNAENVVQLKVIATCPLPSPLSWCAHSWLYVHIRVVWLLGSTRPTSC